MINRRLKKYSLNEKHFVHCSFLNVLYLLIYNVFSHRDMIIVLIIIHLYRLYFFCKSFCTFFIRSADTASDVYSLYYSGISFMTTTGTQQRTRGRSTRE